MCGIGLAAALEPITEQVPVRSIVRVLSDLLLGPQNSNAGANFAHAPLHALPRVSSPAEVEVLDICSMGAHGYCRPPSFPDTIALWEM